MIQIQSFMRMTSTDKAEYLSLRLDEVPKLDSEVKEMVTSKLCDKSVGIKRDRRMFIVQLPKNADFKNKVKFKHNFHTYKVTKNSYFVYQRQNKESK